MTTLTGIQICTDTADSQGKRFMLASINLMLGSFPPKQLQVMGVR